MNMKTRNINISVACMRILLSTILLTLVMSAKADVTIIEDSPPEIKAMDLKDNIVPIKPPLVWTMTGGHSVGQELKMWGEKAGWNVIWNMPKDWSVPASTQFTGEFPVVATDVIKTLASNGALIHAQFFEGNKTMVVSGPGVSE